MIDKPDPKDAGRSDAPGAKRPHATLDLKATEVKPPWQASAASTSASSASSSSGPAATGSSAASTDKPDASVPGATSAAEKSAPAKSAAEAAAKPAAPNATGKADATAKAAPKASSGGASAGSFFSHLAAGVIGGALVYAGTAALGPKPSTVQTGVTEQLAARVSALEAKGGADLDALNAKIGDAESRLAKLDELSQSLTQLRDAQGALEAQTKTLSEASQRSDGAAEAERIGKLEEQLKLIASGSTSAEGGVPQLAAISSKIADVETSLAGQIAELRKGLPTDVTTRIASTQESSEAARAAATRLDRELSQVRQELQRGTQKADTAKADTDRLAADVEASKAETAKLSSSIGEFRSSIDSQLKSFAKPQDVTNAVGPVNSKIAELEQTLKSVVSNEQSRRQNAERIVLSLELSNLKRALDRGQGQGYAAELEEVRKASAGQLDLAPLERFKNTGVATVAQLKSEFRPLISAVIDADLEPSDGSVIDRLLAGAKSVVRVRKVSHEADDTSTEAIVGRMEAALNDGQLGEALAQAKNLPQRARVPIDDWLIKLTARDTVDQAIAAVETKLKASLAGAPETPAPAAPAPVQN